MAPLVDGPYTKSRANRLKKNLRLANPKLKVTVKRDRSIKGARSWLVSFGLHRRRK